MPKENIERAVAKGMAKDSGDFERVLYEAFGPGGAALLIDALTDNKNRTTQEIKHLLITHGVELSAPGAASWAFSKTSDGSYAPHEPYVDVVGPDEERLETILTELDEHADVQRVFSNARGYENTGD